MNSQKNCDLSDKSESSEGEIVLDNEEKIIHNVSKFNDPLLMNIVVSTLEKKIDHK